MMAKRIEAVNEIRAFHHSLFLSKIIKEANRTIRNIFLPTAPRIIINLLHDSGLKRILVNIPK